MAELTIAQQLQYAKLQMAAEAFLANPDTGVLKDGLPSELLRGNGHASKFATQAEADDFLAKWEVVGQKPNTSSGFSGTLFKNRDTGECVISFRSTEFVDDAVRDSQTIPMEISEFG
ncbi:MAG: hypothetical protein REI09_15015 [Candidatus Dactylopiibacterium sp.]|nr:hypothetical protein [Candidatus Dactylopiibacterium sp.]